MNDGSTVLKTVFETFFAALVAKGVPTAAIQRLRKRWEAGDLKAESIKAALFAEEDLP